MRLSTVLLGLAGALLLSAGLHGQFGPDQTRGGMERELGQFAAQLRPNGSYLGVTLVDIDADRAKTLKLPEDRGVEVTSIESGSPADAAGIKPGDVILGYNGENVLGAQQFVRLVQETPQGRKVKLQLWRDGKPQTLSVTTGQPQSRFEVPPSFFSFRFDDSDSGRLSMDIPNPLLVWKNSLFGMECESVDSQLAEYFGVKRGVLVRSVDKGSAAEKAGVKAGDVLTAIGDHNLSTPRDLTSYMRMQHEPGKPVTLALVRNHREVTLTVVAPDHR